MSYACEAPTWLLDDVCGPWGHVARTVTWLLPWLSGPRLPRYENIAALLQTVVAKQMFTRVPNHVKKLVAQLGPLPAKSVVMMQGQIDQCWCVVCVKHVEQGVRGREGV